VTRLPGHERFHAFFLPDWARAEEAVRTLVQQRLPLSMLRLSNAVETETNLRLAGHERAIAWLEKYLAWRGCGAGKCLLMLGVSADPATARHALRQARRWLARHGAVFIGPALGS